MRDKDICCAKMESQLNLRCAEHLDPHECPDNLIYHSEQFDEYGILIHDGGSSSSVIQFCPWCGTKLPESKRSH